MLRETNELKHNLLQKSYNQIPLQIQDQNGDALMTNEDHNEDADKQNEEDDSNFMEVEVSGLFIKHDFDHIILNDNEVEKFTNGQLTHSTMK